MMKNMTLSNVALCTNGYYYGSEKDRDICIGSVTSDSRKATKNSLFVPLKGNNADGHDFIDNVVTGGGFTLSEKKLTQEYEPYILVEDCSKAIKDIAAFYRQQLDIKVVSVIGSVGKTTSKEMVYSVLSQKYNTLKTEGNFNNELGLPLTVFRLEEEHKMAVLEMGISDFGEMSRLAKVARPDALVFTNVGPCHLENLIDLAGVLKAKSEVFEYMPQDAPIVVNGDDEYLRKIEHIYNRKPYYYCMKDESYAVLKNMGVDNERICRASNINISDAGCASFDMTIAEDTISISLSVAGTHQIMNAMAAALIGKVYGLSKEMIVSGLEGAKTISGRSNIIKSGDFSIIDDCYNANPISMKASIDMLSTLNGRKIAVLGDMGELGKDEMKLHYEVGKYAAGKKIDALFLCGPLSEEIKKGASEIKNIYHFTDKEELIARLKEYIRQGDNVLVKASHFMGFDEIVNKIQ